MGASEAMIDIALSIGFVLGGPAVAALGPRAVYAIGGACGLLGALVLGAGPAGLAEGEAGRGGNRSRDRGRAGTRRGGRARRRSGRGLDGGRGAVDTRSVTAPRTAVRRLATARIVSITGGAAAYAALNYTIFERTGSASWVAVSLLLTFGVLGFVGPPAGMLGDRFDRRKVLIASDLAGAACFAMMALSSEPAWLLTWAFLSALAEAPFWSASEAAIPNVAGPGLTTWANSLLDASKLAGIASGRRSAGRCSPSSARRRVRGERRLVRRVRGDHRDGSRPVLGRTRRGRVPRRLRAGFLFLPHDRVLRTLLLAWLVFIAGMGMSMVADAPLAEVFDAGAFGYGLLIAGWGGGSCSAPSSPKYMRQGREGTWLVITAAVMAAMGIGSRLSPWFSWSWRCCSSSASRTGRRWWPRPNLRQRRAPDRVRSRVVGRVHGRDAPAARASRTSRPRSSCRGSGRSPRTPSAASRWPRGASSCSG